MFVSDNGIQLRLRGTPRAACVLGCQLSGLSISLSHGNPLAGQAVFGPRYGSIQQPFSSWEEAFSFNKKGVEIRRLPRQGARR